MKVRNSLITIPIQPVEAHYQRNTSVQKIEGMCRPSCSGPHRLADTAVQMQALWQLDKHVGGTGLMAKGIMAEELLARRILIGCLSRMNTNKAGIENLKLPGNREVSFAGPIGARVRSQPCFFDMQALPER